MGLTNSKSQKEDKLHIVTFNAISNVSNYNNNIITNFVNNFLDKNIIITLQGINDDITFDEKYKKFYNKELKLVVLTNLEILNTFSSFYNNSYHNINTNSYGFQMIETKFNKVNINIYNTELIPDLSDEFNTKEIRENQIFELLKYICENKRNKKFHLITGCFYDNKKFKEMISLTNINNIITNLKSCSQDNYIFIYSESLVDNLNKLNEYLKSNFNIHVIKQNIYNLGINEHCPFETILAIENLKN
jgi:hypothetical protein